MEMHTRVCMSSQRRLPPSVMAPQLGRWTFVSLGDSSLTLLRMKAFWWVHLADRKEEGLLTGQPRGTSQ